jgi:MFS family permease
MTILAIVGSRPVPPYQSVAWVFIAYAFMGICEGTYGPNMLNLVNHMGDTRTWVILAMPSGVATITTIGFALMAAGMAYYVMYIATAVLAAVAIVVYLLTLYRAAKEAEPRGDHFNFTQFVIDLKQIKKWFPKIWLHSAVFIVNMACLALFNPGCTLYAYSTRVTYRLFKFTTSHNIFMLIYNLGSFFGDFLSRRVMVKHALVSPLWFFLLLVLSFAIVISLIPEIAPLASFGFSWANRGLYAQTTRLIGDLFTWQYHLTAMSTWLFIGDVGSTVGSLLIQAVRPGIANLKAGMY